MKTLNLIKNVSYNIVSSVTEHHGEQQKLFWIQGTSDIWISFLMKDIYLQLTKNTKASILCVNADFACDALLDNLIFKKQARWQMIIDSEILLIKNIDELCGKTATQEEFSKLFSKKIAAREIIIIASTFQPEDFSVLSDRLLGNLEVIKI